MLVETYVQIVETVTFRWKPLIKLTLTASYMIELWRGLQSATDTICMGCRDLVHWWSFSLGNPDLELWLLRALVGKLFIPPFDRDLSWWWQLHYLHGKESICKNIVHQNWMEEPETRLWHQLDFRIVTCKPQRMVSATMATLADVPTNSKPTAH